MNYILYTLLLAPLSVMPLIAMEVEHSSIFRMEDVVLHGVSSLSDFTNVRIAPLEVDNVNGDKPLNGKYNCVLMGQGALQMPGSENYFHQVGLCYIDNQDIRTLQDGQKVELEYTSQLCSGIERTTEERCTISATKVTLQRIRLLNDIVRIMKTVVPAISTLLFCYLSVH